MMAPLSLMYVEHYHSRKLEESLKEGYWFVPLAMAGPWRRRHARSSRALSLRKRGKTDLAQAIRQHIEPLGGVQLALPQRQAVRRPPRLL
jgi:hypothetical protein